jgi:hypothetical protein
MKECSVISNLLRDSRLAETVTIEHYLSAMGQTLCGHVLNNSIYGYPIASGIIA